MTRLDGDRPMSTRRAYLSAVGVVATTTLAGCAGGSGTPDTSFDCDVEAPESVSNLSQPTLGPTDAVVTVDIFEDFACPHCRDFHLNTLDEIRADYISPDSSVRIRHYDAPVPVNEWSRPVANAARWIQDSHGDEAFYSFGRLAYQNQAELSWEVIGNITTELGVDASPCDVLSAASNSTYKDVIDANNATARERDIPGTPTVFVNGQQVDRTYDAISTTIESQI